VKPKQLRIIKCPICGWEYLPAEIFLPNEFLGKPKDIVKDYCGKIIGYNGNSMNDTETYKCDNCSTTFEVVSTTNFTVKPIGENSPHYVTKLNTPKFKLEE
jgi:DNA-directed RNA polymerase subunit RPC12/RpoP